MKIRLFEFLFAVGMVACAGCASTGPAGTGATSSGAAASTDSIRDSARRERSVSGTHTEEAIADLRDAYVSGDYETVVQRAREQLRDSLSTPDRTQVQRLLGRAQQARGRHEQAIEALQAARVKAYENDQSVARIDRALGESYVALYRWPSAASAFRRVLEAQPRDQATRQALAEVYRRSRQWAEAKQQYERLIRRDSSNGKWWARLAKCEVGMGDIGSAISHFSKAHQLLPQSADIALTLSRYYRATMQPASARRVVDTTLTYRSGDARLWRRRADLAFEQNQFERARRSYERAIATGDSSATPYRRIGMIDVRKGRYEQAVTALRQSFQEDSTNTRTTLYLGISYLRTDCLQQASSYLQRTIDKEANGPITEALIQKGNVSKQRREVGAAVQAYKTALRLQPDRTDIYFQLANVYDENYRGKETAARYYRRFLRVSDSTQKGLRTYARDRLDALRPTLHMQEGRLPSDSARDE